MNDKNMLKLLNILAIFMVFFGFAFIVTSTAKNLPMKPAQINFNTFIKSVQEKKVDSVVYSPDGEITGFLKDPLTEKNTPFVTFGDTKSDTYQKILLDNGIIPNYKGVEHPSVFITLLLNLAPTILFILLIVWVFSRIQKGMGSISKNPVAGIKATYLTSGYPNVTFKNVAGVDEAKEELKEIVEFLKDPKKFTSLGCRLPKGALLVGPPGTGKTLLAKAVAGEAQVPFFSMSGSSFVEIFVGVGASRVRSLFEQAKKQSPCIIFIDEIDSIGRSRGGGAGAVNDEREQTLNQLLVEMDGFDSSTGIIILAATNRADILDQALLRPGRFDRRVFVSLPDIKGREQILQTHTQNTPVSKDVDLTSLARGTAGLSGAELENLVNEAAIFAAKNGKKEINHSDFERAKDKVIMGVERKSMVISQNEKKVTAYHEIGHTLIAKLMPGLDPLHKVSIIPRGHALGVTQMIPEENKLSLSKTQAENMIAMFMGGRIAEELKFQHITTGASNDIERATKLARRMVCEWGMSNKFGPQSFPELTNSRSFEFNQYSSKMLEEIELEVAQIVKDNYERAKIIIEKNLDLLEALSLELLNKETLDNEEVGQIIAKLRPIN